MKETGLSSPAGKETRHDPPRGTGERFTPEPEATWSNVYALVAGLMERGAAETALPQAAFRNLSPPEFDGPTRLLEVYRTFIRFSFIHDEVKT